MIPYTFTSQTGCGLIQARLYQAAGPSRLLVQIIHGMAEHMARYDAFCRYLAERGFAVCIHDLAGHGQSAADESMLGYFGDRDGCRTVLDDVALAAAQAQKLLAADGPPLRRVLLGHSMGSFIARLVCTRPGVDLAGAIFSGTAGPNPAVWLGILLARLSVRLHGPRYRDEGLARLTGAGLLKRIRPARTPVDWLTRDQAIVDQYMADPLCGFTFTAAGYRDLYTWLRDISQPQWAGRVPTDWPILLLSGEQDPIGAYGAGPRTVCRRLEQTGHHVRLLLYADARHEMLNEQNRAAVWQDIADFLASLEPA
jgi:alpha-beta hydrolase superfamily lysophospholipase